MPQDFTINPSTTLKFTQWWHNSMAVYNGSPLAKAFLKHINAIPSPSKNVAFEDSRTFSDDGFGGIEQSDEEKEVIPSLVYYCTCLLSVSPEVRTAEPITEENPDTMVDLNQVGNQENSSETLHLEEIDKSVHVPTEVSPPLVDTSIPEMAVSTILEEHLPLGTHLRDATTPMVIEENKPSELWDQFEICCQALALLKPNSSKLTQQLQHGISNI
ncbi:hypothetical protein RHMOL_Rhmol01G0232800 [Rhododendron molle]|uniref:Uncharacterized protein n=1 Tax=Rhododendron molle TaxID=49168 RepID=A0ACC0Q6G1_RHOML|nr:hypothetical protein RHMOL_Rhmol01G0232800 [Rhododendron molle]